MQYFQIDFLIQRYVKIDFIPILMNTRPLALVSTANKHKCQSFSVVKIEKQVDCMAQKRSLIFFYHQSTTSGENSEISMQLGSLAIRIFIILFAQCN